MNNKERIFSLVNQLKNLFVYNSGLLQYNNKTQLEVNSIMNELAILTDTFNKNIKNETSNIKNELVIIDENTGKKKELIDIEDMSLRVKNINSKNNMFSCLKTLALSNKIAHIYDGNIKKLKNKFINYYSDIFKNDKIHDISFMESLNIYFPKLVGMNKYNLNNIPDNEFDKIWKLLSNDNLKISKGAKISCLKSLNIEFDFKDDNEINNKFNYIYNNKEYLGVSYLIKLFREGQNLVNFENKMFAIKDSYISMIGQLLCKNHFKNCLYELVKTPDATPGFEYMLIIDDKELSYYIEVHMPNFIANKLIKKYGMKYSEERSFEKLGASAVYLRDHEDIKKIYKAIKDGNLTETSRSKIITRDYAEDDTKNPSNEIDNDQNEFSSFKKNEVNSNNLHDFNYEFITEEILEEKSIFEKFISSDSLYKDIAKEINLNYFNENYSIVETNKINKEYYKYIYNNFNNEYKEKFINYSYDKLYNGDAFDKILCDKLFSNYSYDKIDNISNLIINLNEFKYDFVNSNKNDLIEYYNEIKEDNIINNNINKTEKYNIINNYINDYIDENLEKLDINNNKKRR